MPVVRVQTLLPAGFAEPDLELLRPTENGYRALLMQPAGPIFASGTRIGHRDTAHAARQARNFLELARARGAHLAVIPEYFTPWPVLQAAIGDGLLPAHDALWVIGCESTTFEELRALRAAMADQCLILFEDLPPVPAGPALLDAVVLLFHAIGAGGARRLVAVVQFKTDPSRDPYFLEERLLRRGSNIYKFKGLSDQLSAAVIICSDAFNIAGDTDGLLQLTDRSTLIHVQLNPDPRNTAYRAYRANAFGRDPRSSDCHIVCLNWAKSVCQHGDDGHPPEDWGNIGGSAWYCPKDGFNPDDLHVLQSHDHGLYYAFLDKERRHGLFFHYDEAVFEILVPKLLTNRIAQLANRNGPRAEQRYVWDTNANQWTPAQTTDSGFQALLAKPYYARTRASLEAVVPPLSPCDVERLLCLTAGTLIDSDRWRDLPSIDSCQMGTDEVARRVTVAQDESKPAVDFRHARLARMESLHTILSSDIAWPPQVDRMNANAKISWSAGQPNFNVVTEHNDPTLVVHLGDDVPDEAVIRKVPSLICEILRRSGSPHRKRVCVVYREFGVIKFAQLPLTRIDDAEMDARDFANVPLEEMGGA